MDRVPTRPLWRILLRPIVIFLIMRGELAYPPAAHTIGHWMPARQCPSALFVSSIPRYQLRGGGAHLHCFLTRLSIEFKTTASASTTRPPLHTAICPCSHVQAMRSAHLLDGTVPSSPPPPSTSSTRRTASKTTTLPQTALCPILTSSSHEVWPSVRWCCAELANPPPSPGSTPAQLVSVCCPRQS